MKIGMPQLFEFDNIEDNLRVGKELGLDFIELNLNFGCTRKEMEEGKVAFLLKEYNMEATLHFYDEADLASYEEVVNAYITLLKRYLKLGKDYIKQINIHLIPGPVVTVSGVKNYIYDKEYDDYINRLIKNLSKAQKICQKYHINMVLENTDLLPDYQKKVYYKLQEEGFRFCYDVGHDYLSNDKLYSIQKGIDLPCGEFHIHDGANSKCHLALSDGIIDFNKFKDLLKNNDSYVVLEVKQASDLVKSVPIFKELIK